MGIIKKGKINDKLLDIVTTEEYYKNQNLYDPEFTGIEDGEYIYPLLTKDPNITGAVGCYYKGGMFKFKDPDDKEKDKYLNNSNNVIDFSNAKDIEEIIQKTANYKDMEKEILTNPDNICTPVIEQEDEPNMKGLKAAILLKKIDIDKYKKRDPQFTNNKRLLSGKSITIKREIDWFNTLDMKGTLIIEDKSPDVPNPMKKKVIVHLNSDDGDDIEYE